MPQLLKLKLYFRHEDKTVP